MDWSPSNLTITLIFLSTLIPRKFSVFFLAYCTNLKIYFSKTLYRKLYFLIDLSSQNEKPSLINYCENNIAAIELTKFKSYRNINKLFIAY